MKKTFKTIVLTFIMSIFAAMPVFAENGGSSDVSVKAIAASALMLIAAAVGSISMAIAVSKAVDGTARQPEAAGGIRTSMMMGLVFIETAIIYALITAIIIIFVL